MPEVFVGTEPPVLMFLPTPIDQVLYPSGEGSAGAAGTESAK